VKRHVGAAPGSQRTSSQDALADDVMCRLMAHASLNQDPAPEHCLHNKLGIRPNKD
jgi:hypothetical protein